MESTTSLELGRYSNHLESIYEAAINPDFWPVALQSLCLELDADKAQLLYLDSNDYLISFACGYGFDPYAHDIGASKFRRFFADDPVARYGIANLDEVYSDRRVIDPEALQQSLMHREIRRAADMEYLLTCFLTDGTEDWSGICFFRRRDQSPFDDDDEQTLSRFVPHLRRATHIHKSIAGASHLKTIQNAVLDHLDTGIIVVDEFHNVVVRNSRAASILEGNKNLRIIDRQLKCHSPRENTLLHQSIDSALENDQSLPDRRRVAVRLHGNDLGNPILAVTTQLQVQALEEKHQALPVSKAHYTAKIPSRKNVLITLCDPSNYDHRPEEMLQSLFGLTPAEAALTDCLANDLTLDEAAGRLGRSVGTARVQLQTIFEKTDTNRQSSLIRLIMMIPT